MKMVYGINDKPKFGKLLVFAFQQLLAIMAATIAVPAIVGNDMSASAALFGAGAGTIVYQLFTKFKSPVFLGSSFAFIGSMCAAFAGAASASIGYLGIIIGAIFAGLVYVIIAIIVKIAGVNWINKLMPPIVIGPTVALIGLSLAGAAVKDAVDGNGSTVFDINNNVYIMDTHAWLALICALVTLIVVVICSTYGKKMAKLIPFIIGILSGYAVAGIFTIIGVTTGRDAFIILDLAPFYALVENGFTLSTIVSVPEFSFIKGFDSIKGIDLTYIATVAVAYVPVAFVVFAEHIADHKNLSSIIEKDLLEEPGLSRTLLGDGVGSMVGAIFGGCPNTTYGESVGCVAITKNASVATITCTATIAIIISFISPFVAFLDSIPGCVMGGVCITLYGFIAVSGLKMIQKVDLEKSANLFTTSVILITGIGGMALSIGKVTITAIASALILGIITNIILSRKKTEEAAE